ncbi:MAG: hypothetical protein QOF60_611 [Actinomycetota bacterium]|nr:hypothetical protein [Actinomycetota bacterium]
MPMLEHCKNFQSRTYASGEIARFCVLDLAPEAPWRCPENCPKYERRMADVGWDLGGLVRPKVPDEPEMIELNDDAAALLDEAEDILNAAGPDMGAEVERQRAMEPPQNRRPATAPGDRYIPGADLWHRLRDRFRRR